MPLTPLVGKSEEKKIITSVQLGEADEMVDTYVLADA